MIQLNFDAATAARGARQTPAERSATASTRAPSGPRWDDAKLELVDGTHPVVYPAAGSHANFYDESLYLGALGLGGRRLRRHARRRRSISARPSRRSRATRPARARVPVDRVRRAAGASCSAAFFNGPTGPEPEDAVDARRSRWSEDWRDRAFAVPGGGALGTGATDFFCGAIAAGSNALRRSLDEPLLGARRARGARSC